MPNIYFVIVLAAIFVPTMSTRENSSWQNGSIFNQFKLFLSISPIGPTGPTYKILFAQPNFFAAFGYTQNHLPMVLQNLYSAANERANMSDLEVHILSGANHSTYINFVDVHGNDLSCYVQVMAGGCARIEDPENPGRMIVDRFTTMTVNSASRIGNASLLRLMVTDPVAQRRLLNERVGVPLPVPAPAVAAPSLLPSNRLNRLSCNSGSNTSTESMLSVDTIDATASFTSTAPPVLPSPAVPATAVMRCDKEDDGVGVDRKADAQEQGHLVRPAAHSEAALKGTPSPAEGPAGRSPLVESL